MQYPKCHHVRGLDIPRGGLSVDSILRSVPKGNAVVSGNYIDYVVAGECDGSVKAYQARRDTWWGAIEGHT